MDQFPLLLKLIKQLSNTTVVEFSTQTAELHSTMESSSLEPEMATGLSRTHGVLAGEIRVISTLLTRQDKVSAASTWLQSGLLPIEVDDDYHTA
jgi:hypothetical protein